jgi:ATP adenylyltransferase
VKNPSLINLKNIWPQERDVFFRPERLRYVRKLIKEEGCVFCNEVTVTHNSSEKLSVFMGQHSMAVVNKYPYNTGHLLILPKKHIGELWSLSKEEYIELSNLLKASVEILKNIYNCHGFNIGMNHGSVAGAGIPEHLHWHIVPRWNGDTNFFPVIAETKVIPETIEQTYQKLFEAFQKLEI